MKVESLSLPIEALKFFLFLYILANTKPTLDKRIPDSRKGGRVKNKKKQLFGEEAITQRPTAALGSFVFWFTSTLFR